MIRASLRIPGLVTLLVLLAVLATAAQAQPIQYGHAWGTREWEAATSVAVDPNGDTYLAGIVYDPTTSAIRGFVAKFDLSGAIVWDRILRVPDQGYILDMVRSDAGDLYLAGVAFGNLTGPTTFYAKMSPDGDLAYALRLVDMYLPSRIAYDPSTGGFVIVGGLQYYGTALVVAVNPDGTIRWARAAPLDGRAIATAVTVDASGNTYVALGRDYQNGGVVAFDAQGRVVGQRTLAASQFYFFPTDLAIGPDGGLHLLANLYDGLSGQYDIYLARLATNLDSLAQTRIGSPTASENGVRVVPRSDGSFDVLGPAFFVTNYTFTNVLYHVADTAVLEASAYTPTPGANLTFQWFDAAATGDGGLSLAGLTIGPPPEPHPLADVAASPFDGTWSVDSLLWNAPGARADAFPLEVSDPNVAPDDFTLGAAFQAWFGVVNGPAPALEVRADYVQESPVDNVIDFLSTVAGGTPPYAYRWSFGDGTVNETANPSHAYASAGRYVAQLFVRDAAGGYGFDSVSFLITGPPEILSITYSPAPAEQNRPVFFAASAVDPDGGPIVRHRWDFGDGTATETAQPYTEHVYTSPGNYPLTLTVTDDEGDTASASIVVEVLERVNIPPYACFRWDPFRPTANATVYFYGDCSYDPDGYIVSWRWDFGDGTTAEGPFVTHVYGATGRYLAQLTVTDTDGAMSSVAQVIEVVENQPPVASFYFYPPDPAPNETVYFNGWSSYDPDGWIVAWQWDFGEDNATAYGPEVYYAFQRGGAHLVTLTVFDNVGASGSVSQIVYVNEPPVASFVASSPTAKVGTPIAFDATSSYDPDGSVASYAWDFGDGGFLEGPSVVSHVYGAVGGYVVRLWVVDDRGAVGTADMSIAVVEAKPPVAIIAYAPARPATGDEVTFDASYSVDPDGSIAEYIWQFGDGTVAHGVAVEHTYAYPGTYLVKLTVIDEDALAAEDTASLTVASRPTASFVLSPREPRARQPVVFTAVDSYDPSGPLTYEWSFGDGTYGSGWQATKVYAEAGTYTVGLTVTNRYGVSASVSREVTVLVPTSVRGIILTSELTPLAGATVSFFKDGTLVTVATTGPDGTFTVPDLPVGTYSVETSRDGYITDRFTWRFAGTDESIGTRFLQPDRREPFAVLPTAGILGAAAIVIAVAALILVRERRARRAARRTRES